MSCNLFANPPFDKAISGAIVSNGSEERLLLIYYKHQVLRCLEMNLLCPSQWLDTFGLFYAAVFRSLGDKGCSILCTDLVNTLVVSFGNKL